MKKRIVSLLVSLFVAVQMFAQTPHGVKQQDIDRPSIWESPKGLLIAGILVVGIVVANIMSKKALRRRDIESYFDKLEQEEKEQAGKL